MHWINANVHVLSKIALQSTSFANKSIFNFITKNAYRNETDFYVNWSSTFLLYPILKSYKVLALDFHWQLPFVICIKTDAINLKRHTIIMFNSIRWTEVYENCQDKFISQRLNFFLTITISLMSIVSFLLFWASAHTHIENGEKFIKNKTLCDCIWHNLYYNPKNCFAVRKMFRKFVNWK